MLIQEASVVTWAILRGHTHQSDCQTYIVSSCAHPTLFISIGSETRYLPQTAEVAGCIATLAQTLPAISIQADYCTKSGL